MTTANAKVEGVPSFWKKWWNALVKCFKRDDTACACSAERSSTAKVDEAKAQEKKAAA